MRLARWQTWLWLLPTASALGAAVGAGAFVYGRLDVSVWGWTVAAVGYSGGLFVCLTALTRRGDWVSKLYMAAARVLRDRAVGLPANLEPLEVLDWCERALSAKPK